MVLSTCTFIYCD